MAAAACRGWGEGTAVGPAASPFCRVVRTASARCGLVVLRLWCWNRGAEYIGGRGEGTGRQQIIRAGGGPLGLSASGAERRGWRWMWSPPSHNRPVSVSHEPRATAGHDHGGHDPFWLLYFRGQQRSWNDSFFFFSFLRPGHGMTPQSSNFRFCSKILEIIVSLNFW